MAGFMEGFIVGSVLSSGNKESDAEYLERRARESRKRVEKTLAKDFSHLPRVIDGLVSEICVNDSSVWSSPFQMVTVGEWRVCLPVDVRVVVGSNIRIVNNEKVRIDGKWSRVIPRITKQRALVNSMLTLTTWIGICVVIACVWHLYHTVTTLIFSPKDSFTLSFDMDGANSNLVWALGMVLGASIAGVKEVVRDGRKGLWNKSEDWSELVWQQEDRDVREKDIDDHAILSFLDRLGEKKGTCGSFNGELFAESVQNAMPPNVSKKIALKKMQSLVNRGLVNGCTCGCIGDFTLTTKGRLLVGESIAGE